MYTLQAKVHYYCREHYYCHMEAAADEGLKKYGNDSVLKFFRAYAMILQGRKTLVKINKTFECELRIFSFPSQGFS